MCITVSCRGCAAAAAAAGDTVLVVICCEGGGGGLKCSGDARATGVVACSDSRTRTEQL